MSKLNFSANKLESVDNIYNAVFPVGYIMTVFNDVDYSNYLGFQWERLYNTFLYACDDLVKVGTVGGEAVHKLTTEEMPSHSHTFVNAFTNRAIPQTQMGNFDIPITQDHGNGSNGNYYGMNSTGGGAAHNNMPPYTVVRMWRRVS